MAINLSSKQIDSIGIAWPEIREEYSGTDVSLGDGDGTGALDTVNATAGLDVFPVGAWIVINTPVGDPNRGVRVKVLSSSADKLEVPADSFTAFAAGQEVHVVWYKSQGSLRQTFENMVIHGFSQSRPENADLTEPGSPIVVFSLNGDTFTPGNPLNGLNIGERDGEYFLRAINPVTAASEIWRGVPTETNTINSFRAYSNDVITGPSVNSPRFDGTVGGPNTGADMILANGTSLTENVPVDIVSIKILIKGVSF